jgi:hypothetical protein
MTTNRLHISEKAGSGKESDPRPEIGMQLLALILICYLSILLPFLLRSLDILWVGG